MKNTTWNYTGTISDQPSWRELVHDKLAQEAAQEAIVLLKNDSVLPLDPNRPISLLGSGASLTVKGGIGSGDVNNRKSVSVWEGLKLAGAQITSEDWIADYESRYSSARLHWKETILEAAKHTDNPFDAYACNPFSFPQGRPVSRKDVGEAQAVVYAISRISGEGKDRLLAQGDYYLSQGEVSDLEFLDTLGIPVILLINAGGPVELTDILESATNIQGVLFISQLGQAGGKAVADVLLGKVCPSGRLSSTWARRYEDYPSAQSFGTLSGDLSKTEYQEGIFVGYRYFDAMDREPLFPFGFGLSYTRFEEKLTAIYQEKEAVTLSLKVKNTGKVPGKQVVQLYMTLPGENREWKRLVAFSKTETLAPGEIEVLQLSLDGKRFASFDSAARGWQIPAGDYGLYSGADAQALTPVATVQIPHTVLIEKTADIGADAVLPFREMRTARFHPGKPENVPAIVYQPKPLAHPVLEDSSENNLPISTLLPLLYGNITKGASNFGSAGIRVPGSAGETTEELEVSHGIPSLIMADGPAGLRLRQCFEVDQDSGRVYGVGLFGSLENGYLEPMTFHENAVRYYQYCTAFPVGTALAQSWNTKLLERVGQAVGTEMQEFHVDLWLAPGMNIHRNPLCGRNYEYYAEDPLLTGCLAAAITRGVQSCPGRGVTIKHFACNNQEDNRMGVNVLVSQRALREIYLLGFEIAVKEAAPAAVMSSYNRVNGLYSANNPQLCTTVLREEWGFRGIVMSDWNTTVPDDGAVPELCASAGNDIIMPGNPDDVAAIAAAWQAGRLTEQAIRRSAGAVIRLAKKLSKEADL